MFKFTKIIKLFLLTSMYGVNALELTTETWDTATAGKTVFVKFFAPWCGHCKKMKPDWDKLIKQYENHDKILIADVNCIEGGKELCSKHGVKGFPTIKHGDPTSLEDYKGGRDSTSLQKFASELKPGCGPDNLDNCDETQTKQITVFQAIDPLILQKDIISLEKQLKDAENEFESEITKLNEQYQKLVENKENVKTTIENKGLHFMKMIVTKQIKSEL